MNVYKHKNDIFEPQKSAYVTPENTTKLSASETRILQYLIENSGDVISRETLLEIGWPEKVVVPNSLNVAIANLRKAFKNKSDIIITIKGTGFTIAEDTFTKHKLDESMVDSSEEEPLLAQTEEQHASDAVWNNGDTHTVSATQSVAVGVSVVADSPTATLTDEDNAGANDAVLNSAVSDITTPDSTIVPKNSTAKGIAAKSVLVNDSDPCAEMRKAKLGDGLSQGEYHQKLSHQKHAPKEQSQASGFAMPMRMSVPKVKRESFRKFGLLLCAAIMLLWVTLWMSSWQSPPCISVDGKQICGNIELLRLNDMPESASNGRMYIDVTGRVHEEG